MSNPITARTRWAAVIGEPVEHSLSPALHNAAFAAADVDAVYLAVAISPSGLAAAIEGIRAMKPLGLSVTVPHKAAMLALVDRVAAPADRIGAVNCVVVTSSGELVGYNTDAPGYVASLRDGLDFDVAGLRVVLLGGGGAARAVCAGLADAGAASIRVVARTPANVSWASACPWTSADLQAELPRCDLLVDCTSVGLNSESERALPAPIPLERLPGRAVVSTLVYHRETALLREARSRGLRVLDGALMLLHQGAEAFTLWTGKPAPLDAMRAALASQIDR